MRLGDQCSACFGQLLTHLGTVWEDSETLRREIVEEYESDWTCEAGLKFDFEQCIQQECTFSLGVELPQAARRNHEKYTLADQ